MKFTLFPLLLAVAPAAVFANDTVTVDLSKFELPSASVKVDKKNSSPSISRALVVSEGRIVEDRANAAFMPSDTKLAKDFLDSHDTCELTVSYLGSGPLSKGDYDLPRATYPLVVDLASATVTVVDGKNGGRSTAWFLSPLYDAGKVGRFAIAPATFGRISGSIGVTMLQCNTHFDAAKADAPTAARMIENGFGSLTSVRSDTSN